MLVACWSAKGGMGTSVVAAALALLLARRSRAGAVLADMAGDAPHLLGIDDSPSPGLTAWLAAGPSVPADALTRIEVPAGGGLALLPRGGGALAVERAGVLAAVLAAGSRPAVADCGSTFEPATVALARRADASYLVTRPCYLALRRVPGAPLVPTGVVLVRDDGHVLSRDDVEQAARAPVIADLVVDPSVARAVDAGVLRSRLPRTLARGLRHAV
jgi:hypothetical protein